MPVFKRDKSFSVIPFNLFAAIDGIERSKTFESHESHEKFDSEIVFSFEIIKKDLRRPS